MRLKTYTADTMQEAMDLVRRELGDEAVIVSTQRVPDGSGVRVTAALEQDADIEDDLRAVLDDAPERTPLLEDLGRSLVSHGTPEALAERLMVAARGLDVDDPITLCAGALDASYTFAPLPERLSPRPFMLIGPPGSGKSITTAKLAARARLQHRRVAVVTADVVRAGAVEQLSAFTTILQVELHRARGPARLRAILDDISATVDLVFIDSPSLNPFSAGDMEYLSDLAATADVEPILVLAGGGDAEEMADMAAAFSAVGATRLLATRLDMTRRVGALLSAADAGQLMFCDASMSPHVAEGLYPLNPVFMARMILPEAAAVADAEIADMLVASSGGTPVANVGGRR